MSGHVRQRGDRWELRWPLPTVDGKRRIGTATIAATSRRAAEQELSKRMAAALGGHDPRAPARLTFAAYLDAWLPGHELRDITRERYETVVRLYLKPTLGHIELRRLGTADIRVAFQHWKNVGRDKGKPLAKSTLNAIRQVLGAALTAGVSDQLIMASPLSLLRKKLPTGAPAAVEVISQEEVERILSLDTGSPHHVAAMLRAASGMRRAEACGLRWKSVDLDSGEIVVRETLNSLRTGLVWGSTKTGRERHLTLPPWAVAELRQLWRTNAERLLSIGIKLSADHTVALWPEDARPVHPVSLGQWCRTHGFNAHALRHHHASMLL